MKTIKMLMITAVTLLLAASLGASAWAGSHVSFQKAQTYKLSKKHNYTMQLCSVGGTLKLDPNDHTNGYMHYKGKVTFTAHQTLKGVNVYLNGPNNTCHCVDCPRGSSHATGLQPQGSFNANEKRTFTVDCPNYQQSLSGPHGRGRINYFVETNPPAGVFKNTSCAGSFNFTN